MTSAMISSPKTLPTSSDVATVSEPHEEILLKATSKLMMSSIKIQRKPRAPKGPLLL